MKLKITEISDTGEPVKGVDITVRDEDLALPLDIFIKMYVEPAMAQWLSKGE